MDIVDTTLGIEVSKLPKITDAQVNLILKDQPVVDLDWSPYFVTKRTEATEATTIKEFESAVVVEEKEKKEEELHIPRNLEAKRQRECGEADVDDGRPLKIAKMAESSSTDGVVVHQAASIDDDDALEKNNSPKKLTFKLEFARDNPDTHPPNSTLGPLSVWRYEMKASEIQLNGKRIRPSFTPIDKEKLNDDSDSCIVPPFSTFFKFIDDDSVDDSLSETDSAANMAPPKSDHPIEQEWISATKLSSNVGLFRTDAASFQSSIFVDPFRYGSNVVIQVAIVDGPVSENMIMSALEQVLRSKITDEIRPLLVAACDPRDITAKHVCIGDLLLMNRVLVGLHNNLEIIFSRKDESCVEAVLQTPLDW